MGGFIKFFLRGTLCAIGIVIVFSLFIALMDGTGCRSITVDNYQPTAQNTSGCGCF